MLADINTTKSIKEILSDYFEIDDDVVADVEKCAELVKLKKETPVVKQGEMCRYIIFNKRGLMRVTHRSDDQEDTFLFGTVGSVFTSLHSYKGGLPSIFSLVSVTEAEVWRVSYDDWARLEKKHPVLITWMRDLCLWQIYAMERRYLRYNTCSAEERFYKFLEKDHPDVPVPSVKLLTKVIPVKYLASYLKISRWTLSRLRNKLVRGH